MSAAGDHLQELGRPRRLHLVGIGGAGMSGIATILATMGHTVTGSDRRDSPTVQRLRGHGIAVAVGHDATLVASAELVGASSAVPPSNPELVEARRLGIPVLWRVELLAALCGLRRTLAVAGTKGKSTTTAMVAHILEVAGERPSFLVGGDLPGVDGGARWVGDSPWFVVEADESDGTFLALPTEAVVVTNV
ncbi:MAG TPA: Mur ligase domain-containing protein, partial [Acidimicrobiales bacterium]|nr:Mur ligase domain-containing protein [Acidimicrobiales bacterium]